MDDAGLQAVYEAADDPATAIGGYGPFCCATCKAYYANPNRVPRLLTPTPLPDDARLGWLVYVFDGISGSNTCPMASRNASPTTASTSRRVWLPSGRWLAFRKRDSQLWLHSLETGQAWAVGRRRASLSVRLVTYRGSAGLQRGSGADAFVRAHGLRGWFDGNECAGASRNSPSGFGSFCLESGGAIVGSMIGQRPATTAR